jgi:hypothetical protein
MFECFRDFRLAARMARKKPWATLVATLSLAVAIGPNSATFTALDALMLKPSSVKGRQVFLFSTAGNQAHQPQEPSYGDLTDYNSGARDIAEVIGSWAGGGVVASAAGREVIGLDAVTENFFSAVGAKPAAGRLLAESDATYSAVPPIVLSYLFAVKRYGRAADAVGKGIEISQEKFFVVGVLEKGSTSLGKWTYFPRTPGSPLPVSRLCGASCETFLLRGRSQWFKKACRGRRQKPCSLLSRNDFPGNTPGRNGVPVPC